MEILYKLREFLIREDDDSYIDFFNSTSPGRDEMNDFLIDACQYKNENIIIFLLKNGGNKNIKLLSGGSLATYASENNMINLMKYLLEGGLNVNQRDDDGLTPLHAAIIWKNLGMIDFLIKSNADVDAKLWGETAASMIENK